MKTLKRLIIILLPLILLSSCSISYHEVHKYQNDTSRYRKYNKINSNTRHFNADYFFKVRAKQLKLTYIEPKSSMPL